MKAIKLKKAILFFLLTTLMSCDFLDIVPEERITEKNTYETPAQLKNYLYSCYGSIKRRNDLDYSVDLLSANEICFYQKEPFSRFPEGNYSPSDPKLAINNWSPVWEGIRRCYQFLEVADLTPNMEPIDLQYYKAEAKFLIAYYHFISLQNYGPTCIMERIYDQNEPISNYPERSSYDEVVAFINRTLDEAIPNMAESMTGDNFGRATQASAWALKSRSYLYAASPLVNGNTMYADFKSPLDGRNLIGQTFDIKKWETSAEISKKALEEVLKAGYKLYGDEQAGAPSYAKPALNNKAQRRVRYASLDNMNNVETLLGETRKDDQYDMINRALPRWTTTPPTPQTNSIAPTLQTVESFYTKNGLPIDQDKEFDYEGRYSVVPLTQNYDGNNYPLNPTVMAPMPPAVSNNRNTMKEHLNREPRFYAWIGFHNGYAELSMYDNKDTGDKSIKDGSDRVILLKMRSGDPHGRSPKGAVLSAHYSETGYLNKKFINPAFGKTQMVYAFPIFRVAELYLNCAEALVELGRLDEAKIYLNEVRKRAGIPDVDTAWDTYSKQPGYQNTKEGLREIVRRERQIEFYLEGHRFWDVRRWMTADKALNEKAMGLDITQGTDVGFFVPKEIPYPRYFDKSQYFMPISMKEVDKLPQMVQNPFYSGNTEPTN